MYIDDILCALCIKILVVLVSFSNFWSWCVIGLIRFGFCVLVCLFVGVVYVCYGSFSLSLLELLMSFACCGSFSLSKIQALHVFLNSWELVVDKTVDSLLIHCDRFENFGFCYTSQIIIIHHFK
jgi:hypothetical protein